MGYMKELLLNWRALVAAFIGLGSGFSFTNTTASIMGTRLVEDLGWSMADFAAVNSLSLVMLLAFPVVGRLTDVIGVRRTALIGFITLPLSFIGLSQMDGSINTYKLCRDQWMARGLYRASRILRRGRRHRALAAAA